MLAVEFETRVENGMVKIPVKYREMMAGDLKIILLKPDKKAKVPGKAKTLQLKKLLNQIREKNIFGAITNPIEWQREIRDEWT
jgi:hypothetical protein